MDTLTHALSGVLLARATHRERSGRSLTLRQRMAAGFVTAAFPDIDFILRFTGDNLMTYLNYHRGVTHSVLLLPLWAWLLTLLLARFMRPAPDQRALFIICCLGLGVHILGDVITSYGTMIFAPLSDWRAALDTTFIIDPLFTGIIVAGLLASWWLPRRSRNAAVALVVLVAYVGFQGLMRSQAVALGEDYARQQGWDKVAVHALPQPLSPLHWKILVDTGQGYHTAYARLAGGSHPVAGGEGFLARLAAAYRAPGEIDWQQWQQPAVAARRQDVLAWEHPQLADFRRFVRFPILAGSATSPRGCYWFADLRFVLPARDPAFTFGLCPDRRGAARLRKKT